MGATQSTRMEAPAVASQLSTTTTTTSTSSSSSTSTGSLLSAAVSSLPVGEAPKLRRDETFEEKLIRKFSSEPLIPIGCMVTAYFLGSGISSFYKRDAQRSQKMMRLRVASQFATLLIFMGYYGISKFDFRLAPMHQNAKVVKEYMAQAESAAATTTSSDTSTQPSSGGGAAATATSSSG